MALLDSIKDDLVNPSADLTNILRKTIMLAQEYQSPILREWVESELNGYAEFATVPNYRRVRISLAGTFQSPTGHRVPGVGISAAELHWRIRDSINNVYIHDSVAALEDSLASGHDVGHRVLPIKIVALLREYNQMGDNMELVEAYQQISRYFIVNILDNIKTRLLKFVLELKNLEETSANQSNSNIKPETIQSVFNINISGNNNVVATGENIQQEITTIQQTIWILWSSISELTEYQTKISRNSKISFHRSPARLMAS